MMIIPLVNIILHRQSRCQRKNWIFLIVICISLLLSMLFPVRIADGLEFDFKYIPVFIAFFYIKPRYGLIVIGFLISVTFIVEIDKVLLTIINYFIISILFFSVYKRYHKSKLPFKLFTGIIFYLLIFGTRSIYLIQIGYIEDIPHLLSFSAISIVTLSAIIYLIEMNKLHVIMMEQLKNADKLNAISQLAASIAHEIRNPMTTIRGFLQLMKDEKNLTSNQGMFISLSLEELDRTHHIINDFLSLARPSSPLTESIPLSKIIFDTADFMRPYAVMSNVNIILNVEDNLLIAGNINECKQLFINVIKNGIEAMPNGGNLEIIAFQQSHLAIVEINDDGIGLSPLQLKQLGQPYYSTKTKGTGLGLMITFDIIKRMKGDYEISSTENEGTSFKITFPM
ncbi:two-component sensor histidine kinase [Cytobacillus depressus]|uniref:histidine kinase n=2 Tax=Cytobacillus depressus TaxID=1602942 RepID=A0A6L3V4T8_9BACI|nr:two-component sensor histidine kinase [Cytobacillus depressus]